MSGILPVNGLTLSGGCDSTFFSDSILFRFASSKFVLTNKAWWRFALLRSAAMRSVSMRFSPMRIALLRSAPLRFAFLRNAVIRNASLSSASLRSAPLRSGFTSNFSILHSFQLLTPRLRIARCSSFSTIFSSNLSKSQSRIFIHLNNHNLHIITDKGVKIKLKGILWKIKISKM